MLTLISTNKTHALKIQRTLDASVERVYKAWTNPDEICKWFGCQDMSNCQVKQDLTVGGLYQFKMTIASDGVVITIDGVFQEIVPNKKLVYTWNSDSVEFPARDSVVSIEFIERGNKTEMILNHTNFAIEKSAEGHSVGWTVAIDKILQLIEQA
jgi:uncharacterized protein YndB with AHSA1/START domain